MLWMVAAARGATSDGSKNREEVNYVKNVTNQCGNGEMWWW
jgi:hypothetical protein